MNQGYDPELEALESPVSTRDFYSQYFESNIKNIMDVNPKDELNYEIIRSELLNQKPNLRPGDPEGPSLVPFHTSDTRDSIQNMFNLLNAHNLGNYYEHPDDEEVEDDYDPEDLDSQGDDDISQEFDTPRNAGLSLNESIQHAAFLNAQVRPNFHLAREKDGLFHDAFPEFNTPYDAHETDARELDLGLDETEGVFAVYVGKASIEFNNADKGINQKGKLSGDMWFCKT
jgi:hypothetical protein